MFYIMLFRQESDKVKATAKYRALNASIFIVAIPVMSLAMFLTYVLSGHSLTTEKVFTVIGIFSSVRVVMTKFVPSSIMFLKEGGVAMTRIQVCITKETTQLPHDVVSTYFFYSTCCFYFGRKNVETLTT